MKQRRQDGEEHGEQLPLSKAAETLLHECRMVLPGIQALFGFQLIAVFNEPFFDRLDHSDQLIHLAATGLVAFAVVLIMTPAAYHRQTDPTRVTAAFIRLATRLLLWSMLPLALGICADFYVVSTLIIEPGMSAALSTGLLAVFLALWWVLPRAGRLKQLFTRD